MSVDVAIAIPQLAADGEFDAAALRAYLHRAEELGFGGVWSTEQVMGTAPVLDPTAILAFAAAQTERVRIGCAVWVSSLASPLHLAKAIASLDQMSGGRLDVGLATGGGSRAFAAFGVDRDGYLSRFTEGLRYMQAVWTQERVDFDGRYWQATNLAMEPKPRQKPYPPIWFGGGHPSSLRRAVRLANGFIGAGSTTTDAFLDQARQLREELDHSDRDPTGFRVAKRVYLAVGDDPAYAKEQLSAALQRLYRYHGLKDIERVGVSGTAADVTTELQRLVAAGTQLLILHPLYDEADQLERLAAEVVPGLT